MSAIDIVRAVIEGDVETAKSECEMELSARSQDLISQGTAFIMNSLSDDISNTKE